jgi:hypothetical protein
MSFQLPNGSTLSIAGTYGATKAMSAVTNANPAVATLAASHGIIVGDIMEVTSGWSRLNGRLVRASAVATNDVSLEGINSSSTTAYPAAGGTGSIREITAWTQIQQILSVDTTGGEQQFTNFQFLESDSEIRLATIKSAGGMTLQIADDPSLAGYIALSDANDDRLPRGVRLILANGSVILYNMTVSLNKTPKLTTNQVMSVTATLSFVNPEPVRYAS